MKILNHNVTTKETQKFVQLNQNFCRIHTSQNKTKNRCGAVFDLRRFYPHGFPPNPNPKPKTFLRAQYHM